MTLDGKDHAIFRTARRLSACRDIARADEHPDAYISQYDNEAENEGNADSTDDEYIDYFALLDEDFVEYCDGGEK